MKIHVIFLCIFSCIVLYQPQAHGAKGAMTAAEGPIRVEDKYQPDADVTTDPTKIPLIKSISARHLPIYIGELLKTHSEKDVVDVLKTSALDLEATDGLVTGFRPLHWAIFFQQGIDYKGTYMDINYIGMLKVLLAARANPNSLSTKMPMTALELAVRSLQDSKVEVVTFLLNHGAIPNKHELELSYQENKPQMAAALKQALKNQPQKNSHT